MALVPTPLIPEPAKFLPPCSLLSTSLHLPWRGLPALPGHIQTQPLSSESTELAGPAPAQLSELPEG